MPVPPVARSSSRTNISAIRLSLARSMASTIWLSGADAMRATTTDWPGAVGVGTADRVDMTPAEQPGQLGAGQPGWVIGQLDDRLHRARCPR